jgi:O-antigen ligase
LWRLLTRSTIYAGVTGLCVLAIVMTWSRGAIIGFVAAFVVVNVVRSRRAAAIFLAVAFVLAALGAVQMLPTAVTQRFADFLPFLSVPDVSAVEVNPTNFAIVQRLAHWTAAWRMFVDHPWLGVGIGNYSALYPVYRVPSWPDPLGHAHNYYLNITAEAGLAGLAAYLLLWGAAMWQAFRTLGRTSGFAQGVALGVLGVLVYLSAHNFVDNLFVHNMYLHIAILLGCVARGGAQNVGRLLFDR